MEQLFNLTDDPGERHGLHNSSRYATELAKWRGRMVAQFEAEGRGVGWVNNGVLQLRQSETYGPNFPGHHPPPPNRYYECNGTTLAIGDAVGLEPNQGTGKHIKYCQDVTSTLLMQIQMVVNKSLCLQPTTMQPGATLVLAKCADTNGTAQQAMQAWVLPQTDKPAQRVLHIASQLCLEGNAAGTVALAPCAAEEEDTKDLQPEAGEQQWILGVGGRLCTTSGCVSAILLAHHQPPRHTFLI